MNNAQSIFPSEIIIMMMQGQTQNFFKIPILDQEESGNQGSLDLPFPKLQRMHGENVEGTQNSQAHLSREDLQPPNTCTNPFWEAVLW